MNEYPKMHNIKYIIRHNGKCSRRMAMREMYVYLDERGLHLNVNEVETGAKVYNAENHIVGYVTVILP